MLDVPYRMHKVHMHIQHSVTGVYVGVLDIIKWYLLQYTYICTRSRNIEYIHDYTHANTAIPKQHHTIYVRCDERVCATYRNHIAYSSQQKANLTY